MYKKVFVTLTNVARSNEGSLSWSRFQTIHIGSQKFTADRIHHFMLDSVQHFFIPMAKKKQLIKVLNSTAIITVAEGRHRVLCSI
jgi:hypothetical protein